MIVAMGRGGPAEPQVAEAGSVTVESLARRVRRGEHAATDYLEDALFAGVTTVGARRVGGGLAGMPFATNVREAGMLAARRGAGLVILEGSGSSIPPMPWDAGILVAPVGVPIEYLTGYLGPYRILRSDLFVITMTRRLTRAGAPLPVQIPRPAAPRGCPIRRDGLPTGAARRRPGQGCVPHHHGTTGSSFPSRRSTWRGSTDAGWSGSAPASRIGRV